MGKGSSPVWGFTWSQDIKGGGGQGLGRRRKSKGKGGARREQREKVGSFAFILGTSRIMNPFLQKMNGQL